MSAPSINPTDDAPGFLYSLFSLAAFKRLVNPEPFRERVLGVQTYGLVAIDPRYREVLYKILLGAVAETTSD